MNQTSTFPRSPRLPLRWRTIEILSVGAFLLACTLFLFVDAQTVPIILWDESRNAVNALEMRQTGWSLITTFGFSPDLWNTKPPLLIWLMVGSMSLFGPTELALRLPSLLASLAVLLSMMIFVRKQTGSLGTGMLAATLLALSPGFFGEHGARTGDYDPLLLLFVTVALQLLFLALHRARPSPLLMLLLGSMVALAALTKTIAAFIPFSGALLYLLAIGRWQRLLTGWRLYGLAAITAIGPLLLFYAAREAAAPGYLASVLHNDMGGRFGQHITGVPTGPSYYVAELLRGWFFAGPLLLSVAVAFRKVKGKSRLLLLWSMCVAAASLLIFSIASTRLIHYALPVFPWLAVAVALSLRALIDDYLIKPWRSGKRIIPAMLGISLLLITTQLVSRAAYWRYEGFPERQFPPQAEYGVLFEHLMARGLTSVHVVDPGFILEQQPGYAPILRAYMLIWSEQNFRVTRSMTMPAAEQLSVVSCEPNATDFWRQPNVKRIGNCGYLDAGPGGLGQSRSGPR